MTTPIQPRRNVKFSGLARRAVLWTWLLAAALVPGLCVAAERIVMEAGDIGHDIAFFEDLLRQAIKECACDNFTMENFLVGRGDIDGDGMPELIVNFGHLVFGGTCYQKTPIFKWRDGRWEEIANLGGIAYDDGPSGLIPHVVIGDEKIGGHRTIYGENYLLRWSPDGGSHFAVPRNGWTPPGYQKLCNSEYCRKVCRADDPDPDPKPPAK